MDNLLAWGQHQLQNTAPIQKEINLKELTERVCRFLKQSADKKSIDIINEIPADAKVTADENQLEFVFRNLISNSIKFSHSNSNIEISAQRLNSSIAVYIRDSGIGMSDEMKKKLLNGAGLASKKGTAGEIGSGLGLMLVQEFITKNKGHLSVESKEGTGTTFKIEIPIEAA